MVEDYYKNTENKLIIHKGIFKKGNQTKLD